MELFQNILQTFFSHPIWNYFNFITCFSLVFCIILFILLGTSRIAKFNPKFKPVDPLDTYPKVSVIMCCKGIHAKTKIHFKQNLKLQYPGPVEFIFVVESETDPAYQCAYESISETTFDSAYPRDTKVVIAGLSYHNAQKIHNMLIGVASCSANSGYVLFVDDDVFLYPGLLEELVTPLIKESDKVILSTGYEFIAPDKGASVYNYALLTYRIHNLFSFITDRPILCWGGCWMSPMRLFKDNFCHLVDCYLDGGYSDDLIISCLIQQNGYICAHPLQAIFPSRPAKNYSFSKYWDFITRQFFVNDTYSTGYNRRVCHSILYMILTTIYMLVIWISITPFVGILSVLAYLTSEIFTWTFSSVFASLSLVLWVLLIESMKFATRILNNVSNSLRPQDQQISVSLNPIKLFIGITIHITCMPLAVIYILLHDSIVWSGVRYFKRNGKIWKVERKDQYGNVITERFEHSIAKVLSNPQIRKMVCPNGHFP